MSTVVTRVFMNGNSQAIRIPRELRLSTNRVEISRNDAGDLIIHPMPESRGAALLEAVEAFDNEFVQLLEEDRRAQPPIQERDEF